MQETVNAVATNELWFMNSYVRVLLPKSENDEGISLLEHTLPFDDAPPLHVHENEDELFYVLEGEILFQVGAHSFIAKAGDAFVGLRKQPHGFRVISEGGARLLTVTRGGFETTIRAASRPAEKPQLPKPTDPMPEMQTALGLICAANGIELLGPPIAA